MAGKRGQQEVYTTELPDVVVSFDVDAFDRAIRSQGVTFIHYRAMRCPVGMTDMYSPRRPHEDHSGCSNGFLYTKAGKFTCLFTGNGNQASVGEIGIQDGSTVSVTLPRHYDGTETPVYVAPFDRLYLDEENIVVVNWQLFQHDPGSAKDKLNFPAVTVQDLVDAQARRYEQPDFEVRDGRINWLTGNRPGLDPETGKGLVCSVRYTYRPYWYVRSLIHEVRVSQAENEYTGVREVKRMPQAIVLQREYIFEKEDRDERAQNPDSPRQVKAPDGPRFGPRF
jgi:hypothetical protein